MQVIASDSSYADVPPKGCQTLKGIEHTFSLSIQIKNRRKKWGRGGGGVCVRNGSQNDLNSI